MSDASAPAAAASIPPPNETPGQEAARLRRERRNAKIMAGGSDRLNKITSLSGRPAPAPEDPTAKAHTNGSLPPRPQVPTPSRALNAHADDPDEVDITSMFSRPPEDPNMPTQQDLFRQMLAASGPPGFPQDGGAGDAGTEDPMMRMMQQLLGGMPGMGGEGNGGFPGGMGGLGGLGAGADGGLPAGLADILGGLGGQQQPPVPASNSTRIWRITHAIFALLLGIYAATSFTFTGSSTGRLHHPSTSTIPLPAPKLFWIFTTIELVLQSSRYFVDGGRPAASGILATIGRFLPEPYANYVRIFGRYSIIYTSIVSDAMVVVFVLGVVAWWRGVAAS